MAKQNINVGTSANDKKGDSLRAAFVKVNANFTELYTELGLVNDVTLSLGAFEFAGSTLSTTDSTAIVIDQAATITSNLNVGGDILPQTANGSDLGSSTLPWRSLYVSNNTIYIGGVALSVNGAGNLLVNGSLITGGGGGSSLVNGANTVSLNSTGILTLANTARLQDNANGAISLGIDASGFATAQGAGAIAIGQNAGGEFQSSNAVAVGFYAGSVRQGVSAVAVGRQAGQLDQGAQAVSIGLSAGASEQGTFGVAIGNSAGSTIQGTYAVAVGANAGNDRQSTNAVAVGVQAGQTTQGVAAVAVGNAAGRDDQGADAVAVGGAAGQISQGEIAVAVGVNSGNTNQSAGAVAVGASAGQTSQGLHAVAIGTDTGSTSQGNRAVAVGYLAGSNNQGAHSVAIGYYAGELNQGNNSIIINATGTDLQQTTPGTFTVKPVRQGETADAMYYNSSTGEITYADAYAFSFSVAADDSTQRVISNNELIKFTGAGGITTSSDAEGNITITGSGAATGIESETDVSIRVNLTDSTQRIWRFGEDGSLTLPIGVSIDDNVDPLYPKIIADSGKLFSVQAQGSTGSAALAWSVNPNADTKYAAVGVNQGGGDNLAKVVMTAGNTTGTLKVWKLDETGAFTFPDNTVQTTAYTGSVSDLRSEGNINIEINLSDSTLRRWQFGEDGHLTLPSGGNISEGGGFTGAIRLTPAGGANANQALLIYPTAGAPEGDHIHLTAGGGSTELYLGDDYHYVKLVDGGNVEVKATTANFSATAAWTFGTDGSLASDDEFIIKAPNGVPTSVYSYSGGGGWNSPPYTNLATTTNGSGTGLTVNVSAANGGYIDISVITINTAGTGYKTGDIITITNENNLTGTFAVGVAGTRSWTFDRYGALTLPSGNSSSSSIQSVQNGNYQSKVTVSPFQILSQARTSQTQTYSAANGDFTSAASDGNGMITFVSPTGSVTEFIIDTIANGGVYERTVRLNGAGPEYGYSSFNGTDQVSLAIAAPAGAVTSIRFSYTRISKIDICPDEGVFRIESERGQDIDIDAGDDLQLIATDRTDITAGTNMRLRAGDGSVQIATNFYNVSGATTYTWTFGTGGELTLPNGAVLRNTVGDAIAFGNGAGQNSQGGEAVAIGTNAGYDSQGADAVAIGTSAGETDQGEKAVAIGDSAGYIDQGDYAVAIGHGAGNGTQGSYAVAIGMSAGETAQAANSIIINATGATLNQTTANTFTVAPIRNISATSGVLQYNASTKEVSYSNSVTAETFNTDQITVVGNRISTTVTNANLELECNGTGSVVVNGGKLILNTGGNAYVESVDYGVNSANSALNIFGGPYQKINLRAGFGTQATWTLATDGSLTFPNATVQTTAWTGVVGTQATLNVTGAITAETFNTDQITVVGNRISTTVTNANLELECNGSGGVVINTLAEATTASTARSAGYLGTPINTQAGTYTLVIGDAGKTIYAGGNLTIPANASVAFPVGTIINVIASAGITIAITSDTLQWGGQATSQTGTRTVATYGMATLVKVTNTIWYISGVGVT
jgi:hypothetical protein